jgi:hypothetical protein
LKPPLRAVNLLRLVRTAPEFVHPASIPLTRRHGRRIPHG